MAALVSGSGQRPNVLLASVNDMNDWVGCLDGCKVAPFAAAKGLPYSPMFCGFGRVTGYPETDPLPKNGVLSRLFGAQPLMTPMGRKRATLRARPAVWTTSMTSSTFL